MGADPPTDPLLPGESYEGPPPPDMSIGWMFVGLTYILVVSAALAFAIFLVCVKKGLI